MDQTIPWHVAWRMTLLRPSVRTFNKLADDPGANSGQAFLVLFLATLGGAAAALTVQVAMGAVFDFGLLRREVLAGYPNQPDFTVVAPWLMIGGPVLAALNVLGLAANALVSALFGRLIGGGWNFRRLACTQAAIAAPLTILNLMVGSFIIANMDNRTGIWVILVGLALAGYAWVLNLMAVKASLCSRWGNAVGTVVAAGTVLTILMFIIPLIVFFAFALYNERVIG